MPPNTDPRSLILAPPPPPLEHVLHVACEQLDGDLSALSSLAPLEEQQEDLHQIFNGAARALSPIVLREIRKVSLSLRERIVLESDHETDDIFQRTPRHPRASKRKYGTKTLKERDAKAQQKKSTRESPATKAPRALRVAARPQPHPSEPASLANNSGDDQDHERTEYYSSRITRSSRRALMLPTTMKKLRPLAQFARAGSPAVPQREIVEPWAAPYYLRPRWRQLEVTPTSQLDSPGKELYHRQANLTDVRPKVDPRTRRDTGFLRGMADTAFAEGRGKRKREEPAKPALSKGVRPLKGITSRHFDPAALEQFQEMADFRHANRIGKRYYAPLDIGPAEERNSSEVARVVPPGPKSVPHPPRQQAAAKAKTQKYLDVASLKRPPVPPSVLESSIHPPRCQPPSKAPVPAPVSKDVPATAATTILLAKLPTPRLHPFRFVTGLKAKRHPTTKAEYLQADVCLPSLSLVSTFSTLSDHWGVEFRTQKTKDNRAEPKDSLRRPASTPLDPLDGSDGNLRPAKPRSDKVASVHTPTNPWLKVKRRVTFSSRIVDADVGTAASDSLVNPMQMEAPKPVARTSARGAEYTTRVRSLNPPTPPSRIHKPLRRLSFVPEFRLPELGPLAGGEEEEELEYDDNATYASLHSLDGGLPDSLSSLSPMPPPAQRLPTPYSILSSSPSLSWLSSAASDAFSDASAMSAWLAQEIALEVQTMEGGQWKIDHGEELKPGPEGEYEFAPPTGDSFGFH